MPERGHVPQEEPQAVTTPNLVALSIDNPLPSVIVALAEDVAKRIVELKTEALIVAKMPLAAVDRGAAVKTLVEIAKMRKDLEANRKTLKAPVLELGREIDGAANGALDELDVGKEALERVVQRLDAAERQERERIEAENRRAMEEALRKADAERAAKEAEIAELTKDASTPEDLRAAAELEVEVVHVVNAHAVVELAAIPEKTRTPVSTRMVKEVKIIDPDLIPDRMNGLELKKLVESNIKKLLIAGVDVPGAKLVEVPQLQTRTAGW
jgi:hypothetical protein